MLDVFSRSKVKLDGLHQQFLPRIIGHVDRALVALVLLRQRWPSRTVSPASMCADFEHGFFKIWRQIDG